MFPIALEALKLGIKKIIAPKENAKEAAIVQDMEVIGVENLKELLQYLDNEIKIDKEEVDIEEIFKKKTEYEMDFCNVKGQAAVKRAFEVAAARRTQYTLHSGYHGCRQNNACKMLTINTSRFKLRRGFRSYKNT